jgi:hypothetical protein
MGKVTHFIMRQTDLWPFLAAEIASIEPDGAGQLRHIPQQCTPFLDIVV